MGSFKWITRRGYVLTLVLAIIWPLLSVPAGVFTEAYFAFWVMVSICRGFGAAGAITLIPLYESKEDISGVFRGMRNRMAGRPVDYVPDEEPTPVKKLADDETPTVNKVIASD